MSKMGNIIHDIQDRLVNSSDSPQKIAEDLGVSLKWVLDTAQQLNEDEYSPYGTSNS